MKTLPDNPHLDHLRQQAKDLLVMGWEHAGGKPPSWELAETLAHWAVDPDGGVNAAGIRSMMEGYREVAGTVPVLDLAAFRGSAVSLGNYVAGEVEAALAARGEARRRADRGVRHLLAHLPSRATFEAICTISRPR